MLTIFDVLCIIFGFWLGVVGIHFRFSFFVRLQTELQNLQKYTCFFAFCFGFFLALGLLWYTIVTNYGPGPLLPAQHNPNPANVGPGPAGDN